MFLLPGNAVNRSAPLNRGLVSWWMALPNRLGGGGNTFRDLMGRNHGTLTNGPTWSGNSRPGGWGSLKFDDTNDYVDTNAGTQMAAIGTGAFLWECWFYRLAAGNRDALIQWKNSGGTEDIGLEVDTSNHLNMYMNGTVATGSTTVTANAWHYAAITRNGSTVNLYLDSQTVVEATGTNSTNFTTYQSRLWLGSNHSSFSPVLVLNGYLDNVRISTNSQSLTFLASRRGYQNELNWQRYPVYGAEQAAATFNPAWAINSNAYIHLGA